MADNLHFIAGRNFFMGSENDHIIYTAEDIQQYLSGKLGPAEMHAMEKAALDDAFLAEAMEGYAGMQEKDWKNQLLLLKNNFSTGQTAKVVSLSPPPRYNLWKVAAAILIIFGGAAITYTIINKGTNETSAIAVINTKRDSAINTVTSEDSKSMAPETTIAPPAVATIKSPPAKQQISPRPDKELMGDSILATRSGVVAKQELKRAGETGNEHDHLKKSDDFATDNPAPSTPQYNIEQYKTTNSNADKAAPHAKSKKADPVFTHKFTAQVVAPDGSPLPFANISIINDNIGTYADAKGHFRLVSSDSLLNIEIKSAGYITRNFTLISDTTQNRIVLSEDELALKEKTVVTGKLAASAPGRRRRATLVADSAINVEPADGWYNYDTYITNNLSLSDDVLKRKIHGEVAITFEVQSDGAITNMKIDKSLCGDCDEAALRVIKDGPRWKVKKGNQATATVKVKF